MMHCVIGFVSEELNGKQDLTARVNNVHRLCRRVAGR